MKIISICYITQNWKVGIYSNSETMKFVLFFLFKNYLPRVFSDQTTIYCSIFSILSKNTIYIQQRLHYISLPLAQS